MKKILFASASVLSANLLSLVLDLLPQKIGLTTIGDLAQLGQYADRVDLLLVDWNLFESDTRASLLLLRQSLWNPVLKNTPKILICPREQRDQIKIPKGFDSLHAKPFLPEELAQLIVSKLPPAKRRAS